LKCGSTLIDVIFFLILNGGFQDDGVGIFSSEVCLIDVGDLGLVLVFLLMFLKGTLMLFLGNNAGASSPLAVMKLAVGTVAGILLVGLTLAVAAGLSGAAGGVMVVAA